MQKNIYENTNLFILTNMHQAKKNLTKPHITTTRKKTIVFHWNSFLILMGIYCPMRCYAIVMRLLSTGEFQLFFRDKIQAFKQHRSSKYLTGSRNCFTLFIINYVIVNYYIKWDEMHDTKKKSNTATVHK